MRSNSWTWPLVGAWVLVLLYLLATCVSASPTAEGQTREPCKSEIPYCCWAPDSLPVCQLEDDQK